VIRTPPPAPGGMTVVLPRPGYSIRRRERLLNEHRYRDQSRSIYVLAMLSVWWQHQCQVFACRTGTHSAAPSVRMPVITSVAR
jgi:hypothetical protein